MLATTPKTVFTGCKIYTLVPSMPEVEALCVSQGRIECLGSRTEVLAYAQRGEYEVVNLKGGALYPGFIDTHSHLSLYAAWIQQTPCGTHHGSIANILQSLRQQGQEKTNNSWICGYGYDDTGIADARHLTRHDLDAVSTDRPVIVQHISAHFCYLNTLALKQLNFSATTSIEGGTVHLGDDGQPNGLLAENAAFQAMAALPPLDAQGFYTDMQQALADYSSKGITTFQDGGLGIAGLDNSRTMLQVYHKLARHNKLPIRAYLQMTPNILDELQAYGLWGLQSDYLNMGGLKYFTDGSIQGYTAALKQGYHSRPDYKGELIMSQDSLDELIMGHHLQGQQIAIHCNGDAAIDATLLSFEKAHKVAPTEPLRHMIIHAQTASDSQLERMGKLGIIPSFFSRHIEVWGDRHHDIFLGPERTARLNPAGSCQRMGMPFTLHVDTPVLPVTVLDSIHAAVNRVSRGGKLLGADQRISPLEALKAYTTYASLCCNGEHDRGCLAAGRWADFVHLSDDLLTIAHDKINTIEVCHTICGGEVVYSR